MQAVQARRYILTGTVIATVVAAILIVGTLAVTSFDSESAGLSNVSLSSPAVPQFDEISFMETNTQQIPYTPEGTLSYEESMFWEANTQQIPYTAVADPYTGTLPEE